MEEPFDELMRAPARKAKKNFGTAEGRENGAVNTTNHSQTLTSSARNAAPPPSSVFASRSSGPPNIAFSSLTTSRWSQYEKDEERLRLESERATGRAVASAAERAAYSEDIASGSIEVALNNNGASLPHPDEIKGHTGRFSEFSNKFSRGPIDDDHHAGEEHDRVRETAMKVLQMATNPEAKKRIPSKLAGINFARSASRNGNNERSWAVGNMNSDDEEDLVDIVQMKSPASRQSSQTEELSSRSWSSRYNVDHRVVAMSTAKDIVDDYDSKGQVRMESSARNLAVRSFLHEPTKLREAKVFGSEFSFKAKKFFSSNKQSYDPRNINLKTIWMDVDLQSDGKSLSPTLDMHRGPKSMKQRRKLLLTSGLMIILVSILAAVFGHHHITKDVDLLPNIDENSVKFYVISDVPYDSAEEENIIRDLETIPGNIDFLIHLGNIQDAAVSLCPQQAYISAKAIFRRSPVPVFVLPGPNDWNNCPDPEIALNDWNHQLGKFEQFFVNQFGVKRQVSNDVNFAFIQKGVLFIGLHLVGGRKHNKKEWRMRHQSNVQWVEDQLSISKKDEYRAVILLANARPGEQQKDFFQEIFDDIEKVEKPVLYIHANGGNGKFETYNPFPKNSKLSAVQINSGGSNPPLLVAVGEGNNPFLYSS